MDGGIEQGMLTLNGSSHVPLVFLTCPDVALCGPYMVLCGLYVAFCSLMWSLCGH